MSNPSRTLDEIIKLIDKDVKLIKKGNKIKQLDPADAYTLCRYASALDGIISAKEKERNSAKKELEKLSTDELIKKYEEEKK